jgi:signal transduction histidine kinase
VFRIDQVAGLLSPAPQPLPPNATGPRALRRLPHVLVVLGAVLLGLTGADTRATLLAALHAATLVLALHRPVVAWWLSTVLIVAIPVLHPPTPSNRPWAWAVHAGVLLLVALRNPPAVAAVAATVSGLAAVGLKLAGDRIGPWSVVQTAAVLCALATVTGGILRSRRQARERLAEQQALMAHERSRRMLLEERARIARELHDVVAHHMSLVAIQADAAPHRVASPPPELVAAFAAIRGNALEALTELRRVLGVLRDSGPAADRPQPGLDQLDDVFSQVRDAGLDVTAAVGRPGHRLPPGVDLSAFRIVQESLSNALRHAPGSRVRVEIAHSAATLRIHIVNSPPPGPVRPAGGDGHGVLGMRERAAMLGGRLTAGPTPDGGYQVSAELPLQEDPT